MNTRQLINKLRNTEKAPQSVVEAAKRVQKTVINIKRSEVNIGFNHSILLHDVCVFIECCKKEYNGIVVIETVDAAEIPANIALGVAIGLLMDWLRIFEVPVYDIEFPNPENWEYDENDDDKEWVKEQKQDARNSINQYRLLQIRFLVSAVCKTLGIDFEY